MVKEIPANKIVSIRIEAEGKNAWRSLEQQRKSMENCLWQGKNIKFGRKNS